MTPSRSSPGFSCLDVALICIKNGQTGADSTP